MSSPCNVVVADDNRDAADTLVELLGAMGYVAVAAYNGREAIDVCFALRPQLAILDIQMPLLDGCAAARLIRMADHPPAMIASLSALRHWDEPMKSQSSVFDVRLAKPARMDQLSDLLAKAFGVMLCNSATAGSGTNAEGEPVLAAPGTGQRELNSVR
jgi:CheY-like chemotaxis protein